MLEASYDMSLGLHEVCKYRFGPPIHMSNNIFQLVIKTKSFKELPADLKEIVEKAALAATMQGYANFWQDTIAGRPEAAGVWHHHNQTLQRGPGQDARDDDADHRREIGRRPLFQKSVGVAEDVY
jgi:hypothetical protein